MDSDLSMFLKNVYQQPKWTKAKRLQEPSHRVKEMLDSTIDKKRLKEEQEEGGRR